NERVAAAAYLLQEPGQCARGRCGEIEFSHVPRSSPPRGRIVKSKLTELWRSGTRSRDAISQSQRPPHDRHGPAADPCPHAVPLPACAGMQEARPAHLYALV